MLARLVARTGARFGAALARLDFKDAADAAFAARLGASGVTDAGAFGNAFVEAFLEGPGRFKSVL